MPEKFTDDYSNFRVLTNHDAQTLQVGDRIESGKTPGKWNVVVDVKRKRGRGGETKEVHLDNGYIFDPVNPADKGLRRMTILRPLAKFRPSAFAPLGMHMEQQHRDHLDPTVKVKKEKKTRADRAKAGSRK